MALIPQAAPHETGVTQTPSSLIVARELLVRTVELPGGERELLAVLSEYRAALSALIAEGDKTASRI
jgi:hypothetical protein